MGEHDHKPPSNAGGVAPTGMSETDHTRFVDLLLQQTAQVAGRASLQSGESLLHDAALAVGAGNKVLLAAGIPDGSILAKQLFVSLDGAYAQLGRLIFTLASSS